MVIKKNSIETDYPWLYPIMINVGDVLVYIPCSDKNAFTKISKEKNSVFLRNANSPKLKVNFVMSSCGNIYTFKRIDQKYSWAGRLLAKWLHDFSLDLAEYHCCGKMNANDLRVFIKEFCNVKNSHFKTARNLNRFLAKQPDNPLVDEEMILSFYKIHGYMDM